MLKWITSFLPGACPAINASDYAALRESGIEHLLLDVRHPEEIAGGAIDGHTNIPLPELKHRMGEITAWKDRKVVCMCRSGARSTIALRQLQRAGFTDVCNLKGGFMAWPGTG